MGALRDATAGQSICISAGSREQRPIWLIGFSYRRLEVTADQPRRTRACSRSPFGPYLMSPTIWQVQFHNVEGSDLEQLMASTFEIAAPYHALSSIDQDQGPIGEGCNARYDRSLECEQDRASPNALQR